MYIFVTVLLIISAAMFLCKQNKAENKTVKSKNIKQKRQVCQNNLKNQIKGSVSEWELYNKLLEFSDFKILIPNVYIPKENGKTTEIDLLMLTLNGIFVYENKNYNAWIYGTDTDTKWTYINKNKKFSFYNPIKQNENHIKHLMKYLNINNRDIFINIVNFANRATLKSITVNKNDVYVTQAFNSLIKTEIIYEQREKQFTKDEICKIYETLKDNFNVSDDIKEQHIKNIEMCH